MRCYDEPMKMTSSCTVLALALLTSACGGSCPKGGDEPATQPIFAGIGVKCGKTKYALTTGNENGNCKVFTDDNGNTKGGACLDGKGNGASVTCDGNGGDGRCVASTGSGDCQIKREVEDSLPTEPSPGAATP